MPDTLTSATATGPRYRREAVPVSGSRLLIVWLLSITLHLAALALMFHTVFPFFSSDDEPLPLLSQVDLVGPLNETPTPTPMTDRTATTPLAEPRPVHFVPTPTPSPVLDRPTTPKPELSVIGIGAGGGDFGDLGLSTGQQPGPEFFGLGESARGARNIAYVVDRSGSMIDTFGYVRQELRRSISDLRRSHKFHVIFFNAREPLENPPRRLVNAIEAHKQQFFEFMDRVVPSGGTLPEGAMRLAMNLEPDVIYFLSDGIFPAALLQRMDEWNADRRVRVYTIAYLDREGASLLESLAREHRGEFRYVSEHDLRSE